MGTMMMMMMTTMIMMIMMTMIMMTVMVQEALERGVVLYLPKVDGRPVMSKKKKDVCRDPLKDRSYEAVS